MQSIEEKRTEFSNYIEKDIKVIRKLEEELKLNKEDENLLTKLSDRYRRFLIHKSHLDYMREDNEVDSEKRSSLFTNYSKIIDSIIPNDIPMVFHGNNNIGIIESILESGGLSTPEERNESYHSFATQVDVAAKKNIQVPLQFAEPGEKSYMPYGAIFAFMPKEEERENVLKTGMGTEVFGGVSGINFRNEPDRLIGIITTEENINRVREWCIKYGVSPDKVFTHESFVEAMKKFDFDSLRNKKTK